MAGPRLQVLIAPLSSSSLGCTFHLSGEVLPLSHAAFRCQFKSIAAASTLDDIEVAVHGIVARQRSMGRFTFVDLTSGVAAATDAATLQVVVGNGQGMRGLHKLSLSLLLRRLTGIRVTGAPGRTRSGELSLFASAVELQSLPPEPTALLKAARLVACASLAVEAAAAASGITLEEMHDLVHAIESEGEGSDLVHAIESEGEGLREPNVPVERLARQLSSHKVKSSQAKPSRVESSRVESHHVESSQAESNDVKSSQATPVQAAHEEPSHVERLARQISSRLRAQTKSGRVKHERPPRFGADERRLLAVMGAQYAAWHVKPSTELASAELVSGWQQGALDPERGLPRGLSADESAVRLAYLREKKIPQARWMLHQIDNLLRQETGERVTDRSCVTDRRVTDGRVTDKTRAGRRLIVDLGCGRGDFTLLLACAHPQISILGIDTNAQAVGAAAQRASAAGVANAHFICADAADLLLDTPLRVQGTGLEGAEVGADVGGLEGVEVLVALHACGGLSDVALEAATHLGASCLVCTCCFNKHRGVRVRRASCIVPRLHVLLQQASS